jgi:hypothetical protein
MNAWKLQHTRTYKAQSQPNKTDFYQQVLANASIYQNDLVKAWNAFTSFFLDFYHLTVVNARMYR